MASERATTGLVPRKVVPVEDQDFIDSSLLREPYRYRNASRTCSSNHNIVAWL